MPRINKKKTKPKTLSRSDAMRIAKISHGTIEKVSGGYRVKDMK
jgi:hypothetical protein